MAVKKLKAKRNRNPVYQKGYEEGFEHGKSALVDLVSGHLEQLRTEQGVGPKTWEKIESCLISMAKEQEEAK